MATYGIVKDHIPGVDDWPTYVERLEHYFITNDAKDEGKKWSILLTVCGPSTYKLLCSSVLDSKLDSDSDSAKYGSPVKLLQDYYSSKPLPIIQHLHFNTRTRSSSESVATYIAAL